MRGKAYKTSLQSRSLYITPAHAGKSDKPISPDPAGRDHPRACGEKSTAAPLQVTPLGSPPRMRGKATPLKSTARAKGITPAHAGKSQINSLVRGEDWDHPRACGEKLPCMRGFAWAKGSPPRMRGKVQAQQQRQPPSRITPAHAGKSIFQRVVAPADKDHPRACGEKSLTPWRFTASVRITPAHAGKSGRQRQQRKVCRDHPRACGEKEMRASLSASVLGSPPRMRGKDGKDGERVTGTRITPAHAGKSSRNVGKSWHCGDHPRACGEKSSARFRWRRFTGSPPRMRGKEPRAGPLHRAGGITPAHAGKRENPVAALPLWWDHPRACGEKLSRL